MGNLTMLNHSNSFVSKMYKERRQCLDDFTGEFFSINLRIVVKPEAFCAPDIQILEDQLHNLIFAYHTFGCINLGKSAYFSLSVKSRKGGLLYETHRYRFDETPDVMWDERKLWIDQTDEYVIELELDERFGKTLPFWHWMEQSDAAFWNDVEMMGFVHCDSNPNVTACFGKGKGRKAVFVSSLDAPTESSHWFNGTYHSDSMMTDWFSMNIKVYDPDLWEKLLPLSLQIAAVNQIDLNPNLSLYEKVTDARSPEEAQWYLAEHEISFYPGIEISAGNKYLLETSIRQILHLLSMADPDDFSAETNTGYFFNRKSLYLEIWDFNPDTFELAVSHTKPLLAAPQGVYS